MNDQKTTIEDLKKRVRKYHTDRGWTATDQKDIAISLALEAAEVLEHFQWHSTKDVINNSEWRNAVGEELSDVLFLMLEMASELDIDLAKAFDQKIKKQEKKYPTSHFNPDIDMKEQMQSYYQVKAKTRGGHPLAEADKNEN